MRVWPLVIVLLAPASPCRAWLAPGHMKATRVAMAALQETDLPAFFLAATDTLAREATLPDMMRNRATPELYAAERSEHYFDLELLQGNDLPPTRPQFIALCRKLDVEPDKVGYLPYAIVETTQRLAIAFAEHRRFPEDKAIQARCIAIAGELAHYAQDMAQPLHVTVHFDGRDKPGSGIHKRMDTLIQRVDVSIKPLEINSGKTLDVPGMILPLAASNGMVNMVYEYEAELPTDDPNWQPTERVALLAEQCTRFAAFHTCSFYLTAWDISATIELPDWTPAP